MMTIDEQIVLMQLFFHVRDALDPLLEITDHKMLVDSRRTQVYKALDPEIIILANPV